jgi:hypothetical protein
MRSGGAAAPRLIALLIDLPDGARAELAARWGCRGAPTAGLARELYEAMVDPVRLGACVAELEPSCRTVLRGLSAEPTDLEELLGRVALGRDTVERCLGALGSLGLVVRVGTSGRPAPAAAPFGAARLAVPREVGAALRGAGVTR